MPATCNPEPAFLYRAHRIALDLTDRQAMPCLPHCGFARVVGNRALGTFRDAWFTESGTDGEWLSTWTCARRSTR
ncbi:MAG: hypothetical protein OXC13_01190 [Caldilineaceae bacterium]|nr:hypothetical protein [Caldilineaceae bacterium]